MSEKPCAVCPAATLISEPLGVVCRVMEEDQARRDSVLEGAPVGVFVSAKDDPSTFHLFCCGTAIPAAGPDADPVAHYTSCPIWAAGTEIAAAERAFAPPTPPEVPEPGEDVEPIDPLDEATIAVWARDRKRAA